MWPATSGRVLVPGWVMFLALLSTSTQAQRVWFFKPPPSPGAGRGVLSPPSPKSGPVVLPPPSPKPEAAVIPAVIPASTSSSTDVEAFNYGMATQQVNPKYSFTGLSAIIEAAQAIKAMGSNIIKLNLDITKYRQTVKVANGIDFSAPMTTMTQTVSLHPDMKAVFDDSSFKVILLWAYTRFNIATQKTFEAFEGNATALTEEYLQFYDLTSYLLKRYQNTGKTFFLGNWEGDWHLLSDANPPTLKHPRAPKGMIDWYNTRQRAIDDAKRATVVSGVEVYGYLEVNQPRIAMGSRTAPCVVNSVLPFLNPAPDFLSYSSYDSLSARNEVPLFTTLSNTISFLMQRLPPKAITNRLNPGAPSPWGNRVFIGEYGFFQGPQAKNSYSPADAAMRTIALARVAFAYRLPFMLYWQLFNNDVDAAGIQKGWWLIDNNNVKQPVYHVHQQFYAKAKAYVTQFKAQTRRLPSAQEFSEAAIGILNTIRV